MSTTSVSSRNPFTAVFAAIIAFCRLFVRSSAVLEDVVSMGERTVRQAREELVIDLAVKKQDYATRAVNRAALRQVQEKKTMEAFVAGDPQAKADLEHAQKTIAKLVEDNLAEMNQKEEE